MILLKKKKLFRLLTVCAVCVLALAVLSVFGAKKKPVTKIVLDRAYPGELKDMYYFDSNRFRSIRIELNNIRAKVYNGEEELVIGSDIKKKQIEWMSSDPEAFSVSRGFTIGKIDGIPLEVKRSKNGIYEIWAQTSDGSVKSQTITIVIGSQAMETIVFTEADIQKAMDSLTSIDFLFPEEIFVFSGQTFTQAPTLFLRQGGRNYYKGYVRPDKLVHWISTNEAVATVVGKAYNAFDYYNLYEMNVTLHKEGIAEIYAETLDGRLQSEKFAIIYGNKNNKKGVVVYDVGKYVLSRLKYPTKTTTKIAYERDPFWWENTFMMDKDTAWWKEEYKSRRVYTYKNDVDSSYVEVDTVEISNLNVTVKGTIQTFSSGGTDTVCGFILKLKYNNDFTKATVTSEKYDVPEVIRDRLD